MLKLVVESELGFGDEYSISSDKRIVIGRGESANIRLPQDYLSSREHCEIYYADSQFIINDLQSSNGTLLNNENINKRAIQSEDLICIGTTVFRARLEPQIPAIHSQPESELTITVQTNVEIKDKKEFDLFAESEEEPSPKIENTSSFKSEILLWQNIKGKFNLSIIAKITHKMESGTEPSVSDKSISLFRETYFYNDNNTGSIMYESDLVPFKPLTDIVVVGKAYTPDQQPLQTLDVGLQVGKTAKIVRIFGDRHWYQVEEDGDFVISEPLPFTSMDLKYEKSFGGSDLDNDIYYKQNPIGCGCIIEESLQNSKLRKLPNIENQQDLLKSWKSRPDPLGLGFYANNWEPRIQYLGSYDEESLEGDQIGLPKNFSHRFYNSAHPDLQVDGYLEGDEKVELVNLSPKGRLIFNLPNLKPIVVVRKKNLNIEATENSKGDESQITMNLDTLVFIPDEDVFYEVFRGVFQLDSIEDVQNISILVN